MRFGDYLWASASESWQICLRYRNERALHVITVLTKKEQCFSLNATSNYEY